MSIIGYWYRLPNMDGLMLVDSMGYTHRHVYFRGVTYVLRHPRKLTHISAWASAYRYPDYVEV